MTRPPRDLVAVDAMSVALADRRLLPYQRDRVVAPIVACDEHRFTHRRILILLPRQTGKTTSVFLVAMSRIYTRPGYHAVYAAQQGTVSTRRFALTGGWIDQVANSPLSTRLGTTRSQGREAITNPRGLSYFMALNPRPGAARSDSLDLVVLDECQEHTHDRAEQLLGDIGPTFATRPWHQMILAGTATDGPTWWRAQVAAARAGEPGAGHLIELGTWPDDADPADPAVWWEHHPGLQAGLTTEDFLADQLAELGPAAFAREYGNRFGDTPTDAAIDLAAWDHCTPAPGGEPACVAFDVTPDRAAATVVGVTDRDHLTVRWRGPVDELHEHLPDDLPVYALPGQAGTAHDLAEHGRVVRLLTGPEYRKACQQMHDAVASHRVHHAHQPELREAWQVAARSWHGDTWVLSARKSGGDITPAAAAVVAWSVTRNSEPLML